ncbi:hypothetical protein HZC30_00675 [Candidatus Woesearchaeota archaeon]|nr:hypothetical protein [Candidatus Woesearchaeota archaeon]
MEKRGVALLLIVILILVIFSSSNAWAELTKYESIAISDWDSRLKSTCTNEGSCSGDCDARGFPPSGSGCSFYSRDNVDNCDDGCFHYTMPVGTNIDERSMSNKERFQELEDVTASTLLGYTQAELVFYGGLAGTAGASVWATALIVTAATGGPTSPVAWVAMAILATASIIGLVSDCVSNSNDGAADAFQNLNYNYNMAGVICAANHYWYQCDEGNVGATLYLPLQYQEDTAGTLKNVYGMRYNCLKTEDEGFAWKLMGPDLDMDGYLDTEGDCAPMNTEALRMFGVNIASDCPTIDPSDLRGLQIEEVRETVKGLCTLPQNHFCAICINPGAPEVCGDGVNNDCGGPQQFEELTQLEGKTSDDCNKNQYACRQEAPPLENSEDNATGITPLNIYNEVFSWLNTPDGGYCCGFNGIDDLGKTAVSSTGEGQFLCLNQNKDLVGHDAEYTYESPFCGEEWCWVSASTGAPAGGQFKIFTIKPPGQKPYDVASNGEGWFDCDAEAYEYDGNYELSDPISVEGLTADEILKSAHRYRCYDEGDHYSWAECADVWDARNNKGIKGRYGGEGLFTLPLKPEDPAAVTLEESRTGQNIDVRSEFYSDYYGKDYLFDFSGYDYLNFMVQFVSSDDPATAQPLGQGDTELRLPTSIGLDIYGPKPPPGEKPELYFSGNVLGYVVNSNLFTTDPNIFMHIRVPLSTDYKGVSQVMIRSVSPTESNANFIKVKNVYLSTDDLEKSQLCSGEQSTTDSSWLSNIDQGDTDKQITGEKLCRALYGKNSWLGEDDVVDTVETPTAPCCGNSPHEYYSGDSYPDENGVKYACWNSQPVASGDTIMDVEFDVGYKELEPSVSYPEETFDVNYNLKTVGVEAVNLTYSCLSDPCKIDLSPGYSCNYTIPSSFGQSTNGDGCTGKSYAHPGGTCSATFSECQDSGGYCSPITQNDLDCNIRSAYTDKKLAIVETRDEVTVSTNLYYVKEDDNHYQFVEHTDTKNYDNKKISLTFSPKQIAELTLNKKDFINLVNPSEKPGEATLTSNNEKVRAYFFDPINYEDLEEKITYDNIPYETSTLYLMAELVDKSTAVEVKSSTVDKTQTLSFSCSQEECLYPLPGEPPYTIKNLHPELYELYFVTGSKANEQTFIGSEAQTFPQYGNVKVKKLAQPVLFVSGDDTTEPNFYGCQAASYLVGDNKLKEVNNLPYCSIKAGKFCAYSTTYPSGKEFYTTINSWSNDSITNVGYEDVTVTDEKNLSAFYQTLELNLKNVTPFLPETRNHSAIVLPARNFLSNAEFEIEKSKISHWEILKQGQLIPDEKTKVNEKKVTIAKDETMRSERIGVEQNLTLSFSQTSGCQPKIYLVDKDGKKEEVNQTKSFSTGSASYLIVEYAGPCVIEQPMLQVVDKVGPAEYNYNPKYIQRAAAACCPETMCWNGYACVEEMSEMSYLSEHVAEGRDYRCIDGAWSASPSKWDWNHELWGFCPEDAQCLVLASQKGGQKDKTYADFYNGEFPQCINNTQYIMDNYCNNGEWTSRTKFVATKLLEVAQTDDYILYCDNYPNALVEFDEKENYLGGGGTSTQTELPSLDVSLNGTAPPPPSPLCFENVKASAEGQRLVPDKENTCVNNVCVLKYKDSGEWKVAFATTLNKPIDDPNSFLFSLDVPQSKISTACTATGTNFAECNLKDISSSGSTNEYMWYSPELNSVIYAKDSIPITPGTFDKILTWFSGLFGTESELSDEHKFVDQAQNFRELYILKLGDKKVTAMQELQNEGKQMLIAKYEGFTTPICDYLNHLKLPPEMGVELLEELSGMGTYNCSSDGTTQRVEAIEGLDFLWPQLTGKLRAG